MKKVNGDLLLLAEQGNFDAIIHGCNCFNTFGAGISVRVKNSYMTAYMADCKTRKGDYNKLGNFTVAEVRSKLNDKFQFTIVNAYTQYSFSSGEDVFDYVAFALILNKISKQFKGKRIGFPYIGCGLAGGYEPTIINMIQEFSDEFEETGGSVVLVKYV